MKKIITIGREFGSGGRTIGKLTAEKLGIACYDSELLLKIAEESGLSEEFVREKSENTSYSNLVARGLAGLGKLSYTNTSDYLWQIQKKVICGLAEKENCVVIGRCADYLLRDKADCLRVFIYADKKKRADRIVSIYGEKKEPPEKRIKDKDKNRSTFYYLNTDMKWGDIHNYHICLDSGKLGLEKCADIVSTIYGKK